ALGGVRVEDEPGVRDAVPPLNRVHDLVRVGHLRNGVVADEAHHFDPTEPGSGKPVDQLGPRLRRQDVLLVLQAVARPDFADRDQATRSGVIRTITLRSPGRWLWNRGLPVYFSDSMSMWRAAASPSSSSTVPLTV